MGASEQSRHPPTLKGYEGEYYRAFFKKLKSLGYKRAIDGVINAADMGSPTARHRLFVLRTKRRPSVGNAGADAHSVSAEISRSFTLAHGARDYQLRG